MPESTGPAEPTPTPGLYGILAIVFFVVLTLVVLVSTGSLFSVLVLWLMIALILVVLSYYGMINLEKILDDLFPPAETKTEVPIGASNVLGGPMVGSEVFHVSDSLFTYDQAAAVCAAYDSQLATLEQILEAHDRGAEWCSYGWSAGGMALYPTQKSTWEQLQQEADTGRRTRCGRPGVNGGYFDPSTKFGVNCFGFKPKGDFKPPAPVPGSDPQKFRDMVNKIKDMLKSLNLSPYSRQEWSRYSYGTQFSQNLGTMKEGFTEHETEYTETISASRTAAPALGPFGLRGDIGPTGPTGGVGPASTIPGPAGPAGPGGPAGPAGPRGADSTVPGPVGPTGPRGLQGLQGNPGKDGAAAAAGATGPRGAVGPAGPAGAAGAVGPAGPMGPTGRIDPSLIADVNDLKSTAVRANKLYALQSTKGGFLSDQGTGQFKGMAAPQAWEKMKLVPV